MNEITILELANEFRFERMYVLMYISLLLTDETSFMTSPVEEIHYDLVDWTINLASFLLNYLNYS